MQEAYANAEIIIPFQHVKTLSSRCGLGRSVLVLNKMVLLSFKIFSMVSKSRLKCFEVYATYSLEIDAKNRFKCNEQVEIQNQQLSILLKTAARTV